MRFKTDPLKDFFRRGGLLANIKTPASAPNITNKQLAKYRRKRKHLNRRIK